MEGYNLLKEAPAGVYSKYPVPIGFVDVKSDDHLVYRFTFSDGLGGEIMRTREYTGKGINGANIRSDGRVLRDRYFWEPTLPTQARK